MALTPGPEGSAFPAALPIVNLAQILGGATPFKAGNINDTYRGVIWTGTAERTAIIKDLEPRELANEVLCAALGIRLGLPVPPPFLALATPERLAAAKGPEVAGGRLLFASADVSQPPVAMLLQPNAAPAVLARLAQWSQMGRLYGFDALVANIDRHPGNLLFSGDREVWVIDHGHCFTGPRWSVSDLTPPDRPVVSRLAEWMTPALAEDRRKLTASAAAVVESDGRSVDLRGLASTNHLASLLNQGDLEAVVCFIGDRLAHVPRLAAQSLEIGMIL
jgi:hypothetical protein